MALEVGDRVRTTCVVTENGIEEYADKNAKFPDPHYIHAEKGEEGVVSYIDPFDKTPTVRFTRSGTATIVSWFEVVKI